MVAADKYNQTSDVVGFTDGKFEVWGRRFFTTGNAATADEANVAFYPAAGCRSGYDDHVSGVGWGVLRLVGLSVLCTSQDGGFLGTGSSWVRPVDNTYRSHAFPVRCVRELTGLNFVCMRRRRVFWGVSSHHPHFILRILVAG